MPSQNDLENARRQVPIRAAARRELERHDELLHEARTPAAAHAAQMAVPMAAVLRDLLEATRPGPDAVMVATLTTTALSQPSDRIDPRDAVKIVDRMGAALVDAGYAITVRPDA